MVESHIFYNQLCSFKCARDSAQKLRLNLPLLGQMLIINVKCYFADMLVTWAILKQTAVEWQKLT